MVIRRTQRSRYKSEQRHTHNEAKFKILYFMFISGLHYAPEEIAEELGFTKQSMRKRLSVMYGQGYLWRKKEYRNRKNPYCYGSLKPMGIRVLIGTDKYTGLIERDGHQKGHRRRSDLELEKRAAPRTHREIPPYVAVQKWEKKSIQTINIPVVFIKSSRMITSYNNKHTSWVK